MSVYPDNNSGLAFFNVPVKLFTVLDVGKEAFLSSSRRRIQATTFDTNPKFSILSSLLLLSGDINVNPGPTWKYPCGVCKKPVKSNQRGIQCDSCDVCPTCYETLANSSCAWICPECDVPNYSSSLPDVSSSSLELSSSYHPLSELLITQVQPSNEDEAPLTFKPPVKPRAKPKFGVQSKQASFEQAIDQYNPDVIMGTESWLTPDIKNGEIFPSHFTVFRKDRSSGARGGGVFQAIKSDLLVTHKQEFDSNCECIWTQCQIKGRRSLILGTYYNPNGNVSSLRELETSLLKMGEKLNSNDVLLAGDFNIPNINWNNDSVVEGCSSQLPANTLLNIQGECGFKQLVHEATRSQHNTKNILDLVFTNNESMVESIKVVPGISDHEMVNFNLKLKCKRKRIPKRMVFLRKKANSQQMEEDMLNFSDHYFLNLSDSSVNEKWSAIKEAILRTMKANVPSKMTSSRYNLPWFNRSHRRMSRKKQRLYNTAKKSNKEADWAKFNSLKKKLRKDLSAARNSYVSEFLSDNIQETSKSFWSYIKKSRSDGFVGIPDLKIGGKLTSDPVAKANGLNQQFCNVFTNENLSSLPTLATEINSSISSIRISCQGVS